MRIKYLKKITNKRYLDDIMELLILSDQEFVPPLSSRQSTTQSQLNGETEKTEIPSAYFDNITKQSAFVMLEDGKVIGFMSFKRNHVSPEIPPAMSPNIYITTVIVHPDHRRKGITNQFYKAVLRRFGNHHIFTRTWSTNINHTRILSSHKFYEYTRLTDDRGPGIDTVYYLHRISARTRLQILNQYRLTGNIFFFVLLVLLTILFLVVWIFTPSREMVHELSIAFSTSLIASALCLLSDLFLKYRESKNDEYIQTLKSFGIDNLQFHKDELLENIIPRCRHEIWISGYRLIMTAKTPFLQSLSDACKHHSGIQIKVLTVAPWSNTFRLVYGDEDVSHNYLKVFQKLCDCMVEYGCQLEIRMTEKPLFNDTYKADDRFVTGPYLHCMDKNDRIITAKDFFSLDINDPKKDLYDIIYKDYMTVWESAPIIFDCNKFYAAFHANEKQPLSTDSMEERLKLLKSCCLEQSVQGD